MGRMMMNGKNIYRQWRAVLLTHTPTGLSAYCDAHRSQHQNRDSAYQRLRSLLAVGGPTGPLPLVAHYELPDDDPFPDDLTAHRTPHGPE